MYSGLFWVSFAAATILPGGSEAVFLIVINDGGSFAAAIFWATLGNFLGALTCYYLGRFGHLSGIEKWLRIPKKKILALETKVQKWGPYLGLIAWFPFIGDPCVIALGFFRSPALPTLACVALGKFLRYVFIAITYASVVSP
ncbi:MAG: DedA family protein [Bacteroidetes bacterium]|nr:DedA family protein [Bacteroidota bacterium]